MKTILIFEDDLRLAMVWQLALEQEGYIVVVVDDFDAASKLLQESEIALVISDMLIRTAPMEFAAKGGLSLLAFINNHLEREKRPPVIVASGADESINVDQHAQAFNATIVLRKPVSVEELLIHVKVLVELSDDV